MYRNQIILSVLVAAVVLLPSSASAGDYRELCMSAAKVCTYTGPQAPVLRADVCLSTAGGITLKGTAPCASGQYPYYVEHGEVVDPQTGEIAAYIPLDNACSQPGRCVDGPGPGVTEEYPMCCFVNSSGVEVCVDGTGCGGTLWFCYDGVSNPDGTVTCFAGEQLG